MSEFLNIKNSAYENVKKHIDCNDPPPNFFKLGTLLEVKENQIHIEISKQPVGNCADGAAVNNKAARLLSQLYGMDTLDFRCSAHTADGSLKRLARSETMSVEQVKTLYGCFKTVVKHFATSCKSKELLDEAIKMLELKEIHLLSSCSTRMAHFLTACVSFNEIIIPVYDTMFTNNLRKEERDNLFTAENIYMVKLMCDINEIFYVEYLQKIDVNNALAALEFQHFFATADKMLR